eukprot:TRINITY_DN0_c1_g1_i4.p1 TRINITY_DN0_c1_g1~~TRINITY_DN0_c1_g1_i4.p1  ORF type:complete len:254 (+),score=24.74 TRINITY_DN0_c1_g1_i4:59-763(+)
MTTEATRRMSELVAEDPILVTLAATKWHLRRLSSDQKAALEQLRPQLDKARAVDDQARVQALSDEIAWREELIQACDLPIKPPESDLISSASSEWLARQVPDLGHPLARIFAKSCTEPDLRRYYGCFLGFRGITTWRQVKVLHRESEVLERMPVALAIRLLDEVRKMQQRFGEDLENMTPLHLREKANSSWTPTAISHWFGVNLRGAHNVATAACQQPGIGDVELSKPEPKKIK